MRKIVVIGNGIAGISAARHLRKRCDDRIVVISAESDHFFSRTALMYIYMGHMAYANTKPYEDSFWAKNRIELVRARVRQVDVETRRLEYDDGRYESFDVLILATGSVSNKFGWPGQDLAGVQGLYSLQDLEAMEETTRGIAAAVVVGGGLIGIEMAEMLRSRGIPVHFLVRERAWMEFAFPPEEAAMIGREIGRHGVDLRLGTELDRLEADPEGRVRSAITKTGEEIPCQFVGLTVGVRPNVDFLRGSGIELDRGVLVDENLRTSAPGVYAIGDCAQVRRPLPGRRAVEPLWYVGRVMGEFVARTLCGEDLPYDPGRFFNSAKFFDLEWQLYGEVPARSPAGEDSLYWQSPDGRKSIRIAFRAGDRRVLGFELLGIRFRHELCDRWLEDGATLEQVLPELGAANFDPELYPQHEGELIACYNRRFPDRPLSLRRRRGLAGLLGLLRAS